MEADHQVLVRMREAQLKQGGDKQGLVVKASNLELKDPYNPKMHHLGRTQTRPVLRNRKHSVSNYLYSWHLPCKITLAYKFDFLISLKLWKDLFG